MVASHAQSLRNRHSVCLARAHKPFGPTALENKRPCQSSTGGIPRGEAVNVFSGKSLKEATVVPSAKCHGVRLARRHGETRSILLLSIGCSFWHSFQPPSLRLHDGSCAVRIRPGLRNCSLLAARNTRTNIHVQPRQELDSVKVCIKSNCSAVLKDDKAPEIRTATLLIPVSVHQAHAWCSFRVLLVALPSRGACAFPTDT